MWRFIIIALTLICLVLLGWYAVRKVPGRIEADIQARAQAALAAKGPGVAGVVVKASQRDLVLDGAIASQGDRQAAVKLLADLSGVKSVTDQLVVGDAATRTPTPSEPSAEAVTSLDARWNGSALVLSGELPKALSSEIDQALLTSFDTDAIKVDRKTTATEGAPLPEAGAAVAAGLEALSLSSEGHAKIRGRSLTVVAIVADAALEARLVAIVGKVGGVATVTVKAPIAGDVAPEAADASSASDATVEAAAADVPSEVAGAAVDAGPEAVDAAGPGVVSVDAAVAPTTVAPEGPLTPSQCRSVISAAIEGDKRIKFRSNTGRLTEEGEEKVKEIASILARCPTATGVIEGYHDDYGEPDRIKQLSQIRAFNVHKRLGELGIDPKRFKYIGLGYRNLKYHGAPAVRVLNQRVEFNITVE